MKSKAFFAVCLALLLLLLCGCGSRTGDANQAQAFQDKNKEANEAYFGEELYAELQHSMTEEEKTVGDEVVRKMQSVLEYIGPEAEADPDVGALSRYYWFPYYEQPAKAEASSALAVCVKQGTGYHVWVGYTQVRYDKDGKETNGSWNCLALLTVSVNNDGWTVTKVQEAP